MSMQQFGHIQSIVLSSSDFHQVAGVNRVFVNLVIKSPESSVLIFAIGPTRQNRVTPFLTDTYDDVASIAMVMNLKTFKTFFFNRVYITFLLSCK